MVKARGKVRPRLVIGIGAWGTRVISAFERRLQCRAGDLRMVRAAILADEDVETPSGVARLSEGRATDLLTELEATRKLEAIRAARRAGWDVDAKAPTEVTLIAALKEESDRDQALQVARSLRVVSARNPVHRPTLGAVFLLCPERDDEETEGLLAPWTLVPDRSPFDVGCYLLGRANADGLLLFDPGAGEDEEGREQQTDLVACWLVLRTLTGLDAELARSHLDGAGGWGTFGLATWTFPLEGLKTHLAQRWQAEALTRLLDPPRGDVVSPAPFLERHVRPMTPWEEESALRFRVRGAGWATPALRLIPALREEIDQAVASARERLQILIARAERRIEPIGGEIAEALASNIEMVLDEAGLGEAMRFLDTLSGTVDRRLARCEQEVERRFERLETLDGLAERAAQALDECTARFPSLRLWVLLGLLVRPWRLVRLWLLYREIGRRAGVYLSYCQSQWLLRVEAFEHQWRAALYARLAQAIREEQEDVATLQEELERLRDHHSPDADLVSSLIRSMEEAALPDNLIDRLYRRGVGEEGPDAEHLLALHGPLSSWVWERFGADELGAILLDHAWETFAFLDEIYLDDLLARTRSGAELRRRVAALVEAAAPWWAGDETHFPSLGELEGRRMTFVGLPDAERSPLPDLFPRRHVCFSTGDRHQIVAIQVIRGIQNPSGEHKGGEQVSREYNLDTESR